jgi:hypothetical protein
MTNELAPASERLKRKIRELAILWMRCAGRGTDGTRGPGCTVEKLEDWPRRCHLKQEGMTDWQTSNGAGTCVCSNEIASVEKAEYKRFGGPFCETDWTEQD